MRRYLPLILFVVVLVAPLILSRAVSGRRDAAPAARGDALDLVIITPHQEGIRREFADAFSQWHREHFGRPVNIDYRWFGASDVVKFFEASRDTVFKTQGTYHVDIAWGGGD